MTDQQPPVPGQDPGAGQMAPGWYPDPTQPGNQRQWDGQQWVGASVPIGGGGAVAGAPPAQKGGKKWLIPLVACLALAFIAIVIGAVAGGGDDEDTADDASTEETTTTVADEEEPTTEATEPEEEPTTTEEETTTTEEETTTTAAPEEEMPGIGDTGTTSDLEVTLHQVVDPWTSPQGFDTPPEGQRYIGIELEVTNTADESTTFSSLLQVEVLDSSNRAWDPTFVLSDDPLIDGDVPAGGSRRGWVYVAAANDATDLTMRVLGSLTADGEVFTLS